MRLGARLVAFTPADSDIDLEVTLDVGRLHVARVVQDGDGLGEPIGASEPDHIGDGVAGRKDRPELRDTALVQIGLLDVLWSARVSDVERQSGTRKLVCRRGLGDPETTAERRGGRSADRASTSPGCRSYPSAPDRSCGGYLRE